MRFRVYPIDPWFLYNIKQLVEFEKGFRHKSIKGVTVEDLLEAKTRLFDIQIANLCSSRG